MNICLKCGTKGQVGLRIPAEHNTDLCCKHCRIPLVEIDDNLANIIFILAKAGLKTLHSCEGHLYINGESKSLSEGYISIEDPDKKIEEILQFLPDTIGDYNLAFELTFGPRSIVDKTFINKFVLRFVKVIPKDMNHFDNFWEFQTNKIHLFGTLEKILLDNLESK